MKSSKLFQTGSIATLAPFTLALALMLSLPAGTVAAGEPNQLTSGEQAAGWKLLFDGESLNGWRGYRKDTPPAVGWTVQDGLLHKVRGERGGDIVTTKKFDDFELYWEWRVESGGNNGVKYLVTEERPSAPGHEYQMLDDQRHPDAAGGAKRQTASFYDVLAPMADRPVKPAGEWNASRIIIQGNRVEHWLNGVKVLEYELGSASLREALQASKFRNSDRFGEKISGHIMLTDHNDATWFRNLKIRPIDGAR
jgi:hypothetical protein